MFSADWAELLYVDDAYEDISGRSVEALRDATVTFLEEICPEDRFRVRAATERLSAGESAEIEYPVDADRGYRRWVRVEGPVYGDGEVTRVVGFSRDVTNRRRRGRSRPTPPR